VCQVLLACVLTGCGNVADAYLALYQGDGGWYADIASNGYHSPAQLDSSNYGNVAFFPGYPLGARIVHRLSGLPVPYALLLTAQLGCWGFWSYVLLLFQRWRIEPSLAALGVGLILVHPASFYLAASYSESHFLAATLGFIYWSDSRRKGSWLLAAVHGFVMTGTRLVGLPLVVYPLFHAWLNSEGRTTARLVRGALLAMAATLGTGLFFAYCQHLFGHWDLYMMTNAAGWSVHPDYLGPFSMMIFHIHFPHHDEGFIDPEWVSRLSVPVMLFVFAGLFLAEGMLRLSRPEWDWRKRVGLYICAGLLFYIPAAGHFSRHMSSMIRFSLCVQAVLVPAFVHMLARARPLKRSPYAWAVPLLIAHGLVSFSLHLALTYRFVHGKWVA
jgi:hypothetical protein